MDNQNIDLEVIEKLVESRKDIKEMILASQDEKEKKKLWEHYKKIDKVIMSKMSISVYINQIENLEWQLNEVDPQLEILGKRRYWTVETFNSTRKKDRNFEDVE